MGYLSTCAAADTSCSAEELSGLRAALRRGLMALGVLCLGACSSPMGPIAGGKLAGDTADWPEDWKFTDSIENVLLETDPSDPYSVTIWCVSVEDRLYIAAASGQSRWVRNIDGNNAVILGIQQWLYPAFAVRIPTAEIPAAVSDAYVVKYDRDPDDNFIEEGGIIFELIER